MSHVQSLDNAVAGYLTLVFNAQMLSSIVSGKSNLADTVQISLLGPSPDDSLDPAGFVYLSYCSFRVVYLVFLHPFLPYI
ncbi:hypothetical protein V1519DRAFT_453824 [Lipomyces tetrasporus]